MSTLNAVEMAMMQSPARAWSQRHVEMRMFRRLLRRAGIDPTGGRILDAGCGNGLGLELIAEAFAPRRLVGFDLMPAQIERARRRGVRAELALGDITAIDHPDASFDTVFVFGILHHVPAWRQALRELARVLAPGGALLVEEIHGTFIDLQDAVIRTRHPKAARFDWTQFRGGLADAGLAVVAEAAVLPLAPIRSFCAVKPRG
jgi:ubiquinone/menaquinone biosynthesis C-methylase UbiE